MSPNILAGRAHLLSVTVGFFDVTLAAWPAMIAVSIPAERGPWSRIDHKLERQSEGSSPRSLWLALFFGQRQEESMLKNNYVGVLLDEEDLRKLEMLERATGRSKSAIFRRMLQQVEMLPDLRLPDAPAGVGASDE
jgi:hypothetical protein